MLVFLHSLLNVYEKLYITTYKRVNIYKQELLYSSVNGKLIIKIKKADSTKC